MSFSVTRYRTDVAVANVGARAKCGKLERRSALRDTGLMSLSLTSVYARGVGNWDVVQRYTTDVANVCEPSESTRSICYRSMLNKTFRSTQLACRLTD